MSDQEIIECWRQDIVMSNVDPNQEHDWYSLWVGFVIALQRRDLADYEHYKRLGFQVELDFSGAS